MDGEIIEAEWWTFSMVKSTIIASDNAFFACWAPSHCLNQCWLIVNCARRTNNQWNFDCNSNFFVEGNAFESVVCNMVAIFLSASICWSSSQRHVGMMTSSSGNIFRVTGHLCGEFTGLRHKGQWRGALMFSLICVRINDWVNNREAGDLRRRRAHYDVIVMG